MSKAQHIAQTNEALVKNSIDCISLLPTVPCARNQQAPDTSTVKMRLRSARAPSVTRIAPPCPCPSLTPLYRNRRLARRKPFNSKQPSPSSFISGSRKNRAETADATTWTAGVRACTAFTAGLVGYLILVRFAWARHYTQGFWTESSSIAVEWVFEIKCGACRGRPSTRNGSRR